MGTLSLRYTDRLTIRFGARNTLLPGFVLVAGGLALLTQLPAHGSYVTSILPAVVLFGFGAGIAFPALMTLAMSAVTSDDAGLASGLVNTTAQVGGALGLALLATLAAGRSRYLSLQGRSAAAALTGGYQLAFVIGLGFVAVAIAVAVTVLRPSAMAEHVSTETEPAAAIPGRSR